MKVSTNSILKITAMFCALGFLAPLANAQTTEIGDADVPEVEAREIGDAYTVVGATTGGEFSLLVEETRQVVDEEGNELFLVEGEDEVFYTSADFALDPDTGEELDDGDGNPLLAVPEGQTPSVSLIEAVDTYAHGIELTTNELVLSGGTTSTTLTLNDDGADFGGAVISGVLPGVLGTDAVNLDQLNATVEAAVAELNTAINVATDTAYAGIAISNAMDVVLPEPGKNMSMRLGYGFAGNASAYGITLVGRVRENVFLDVAWGKSTASGIDSENGGKAGVTFQW